MDISPEGYMANSNNYDQEYVKGENEWEMLRKLPSKMSSGDTIVDRLKDMVLAWEFHRASRRITMNVYVPDHCFPFPLDRAFLPSRVSDIDTRKARAAWSADLKAGIRRPDHYYVSQEFYTAKKKEKIAEHTAAVCSAQADKSFWAFSLL